MKQKMTSDLCMNTTSPYVCKTVDFPRIYIEQGNKKQKIEGRIEKLNFVCAFVFSAGTLQRKQ